MISMDTDSDGTVFQLWKQDQAASCGVASAWMARGLVRQMSFAEGEWDLAQRVYRNGVASALSAMGTAPSGPVTFDPRAFGNNQSSLGSTFSRFGLFAGQLAAALRAEGLNVNHTGADPGGTGLISHLIAQTRVAIVLVSWQRGGGHFVVAARRANDGDIVFLDPWDGNVNEQENNGAYVANYGNIGTIAEILYLS